MAPDPDTESLPEGPGAGPGGSENAPGAEETPDFREGLPLALDPAAESTDASLPGFLARPSGAPVYHGFQVVDAVVVEGFRIGLISEMSEEDYGDAFVIAPDGSRAGLVWEQSSTPRFAEVAPFDEARWGVWGVGVPFPMSSPETVRRNLEHLLPDLKQRWAAWRDAEPEGPDRDVRGRRRWWRLFR